MVRLKSFVMMDRVFGYVIVQNRKFDTEYKSSSNAGNKKLAPPIDCDADKDAYDEIWETDNYAPPMLLAQPPRIAERCRAAVLDRRQSHLIHERSDVWCHAATLEWPEQLRGGPMIRNS